MGDALVDLANVCCAGDSDDAQWGRYLAVKDAWRDSNGGRVRAISDASLRRYLVGADLAHLEQAQRAGEVEVVPKADPHLIRRALDVPELSLISNDSFEDELEVFPEFVGFDRIFRVHWHRDGTAELVRSKIADSDPGEASRHRERDLVRRFGFRRGTADFELLRWDWRCTSLSCHLAALPQLDELPHCDNGVAVCPSCDEVLERLSPTDGGVELKLAVDGVTLERISLADGSSVVLGRSTQTGHFDVSHLLESEARELISRSHLQVENRAGRIRICDTGSRNGTSTRRPDGESRTLPPGAVLFLDEGVVACLAGALEIRRSGRRWPRGRGLLSAYEATRDEAAPTRLADGR